MLFRSGNLTQWLVTTKPPTGAEIAMGIRAGEELLERYRTTGVRSAGILKRIYLSGLLHVMAGSTLVFLLILGLALLLGLELEL